MDFTPRERQILSLIFAHHQGLSVKQIAQELKVSTRTIYRELSSLELTLEKENIYLKNSSANGYYIQGEEKTLAALQEIITNDLHKEKNLNLTKLERQHAIALDLILAEDWITIDYLMNKFQVSHNSIQSDLDYLEDFLSDYQLLLNRETGKGLFINAKERHRRSFAASLLNYHIQTANFFDFINQEQIQMSTNYFLEILDPIILRKVFQVFQSNQTIELNTVTDSQIQLVVITLAICLTRIRQGYSLNEAINVDGIHTTTLRMTHEIIGELSHEFQIIFDIHERHFVARAIEGINFNEKISIFRDDFNPALSYQVRNLIQYVTEMTHNDFRHDDRLFDALLAHLAAALKRPNLLIENTQESMVFESLNTQYDWLYQVIHEEFQRIFDQQISHSELSYLVLHFATSYERQPKHNHDISLLIICANGIGSGKILANRIKKIFPQIQQIEPVQLSAINNVNYRDYDFILSTVQIATAPFVYRKISPLLVDNDIAWLNDELNKLLPGKVKPPLQKVESIAKKSTLTFSQLTEKVKLAELLIDHFHLRSIESEATIEKTLAKILETLPEDIIIDQEIVCKAIFERFKQAPIGIPKSHIALFHTSNRWIKQPSFTIYDLDQSFSIPGMAEEDITLKRVLLLLAPDPLDHSTQDLLGVISSSIIDSDINLYIYQEGNNEEVTELLGHLFTKTITNQI